MRLPATLEKIVEHFYPGVQLFTDSGYLEMLQDTEGGPECVLRGTACGDRPCDKIITHLGPRDHFATCHMTHLVALGHTK